MVEIPTPATLSTQQLSTSPKKKEMNKTRRREKEALRKCDSKKKAPKRVDKNDEGAYSKVPQRLVDRVYL